MFPPLGGQAKTWLYLLNVLTAVSKRTRSMSLLRLSAPFYPAPPVLFCKALEFKLFIKLDW